jgi:hypothetical protein
VSTTAITPGRIHVVLIRQRVGFLPPGQPDAPRCQEVPVTVNATPEDRQLALAPLDEKVDHVRGAPAGRLIIEYGDYECPYSRQAFRAIEQANASWAGPCGSRSGISR